MSEVVLLQRREEKGEAESIGRREEREKEGRVNGGREGRRKRRRKLGCREELPTEEKAKRRGR